MTQTCCTQISDHNSQFYSFSSQDCLFLMGFSLIFSHIESFISLWPLYWLFFPLLWHVWLFPKRVFYTTSTFSKYPFKTMWSYINPCQSYLSKCLIKWLFLYPSQSWGALLEYSAAFSLVPPQVVSRVCHCLFIVSQRMLSMRSVRFLSKQMIKMNLSISSHCIFFFIVYENYLSKHCHGSPQNIF